jgi:hypothetical protein
MGEEMSRSYFLGEAKFCSPSLTTDQKRKLSSSSPDAVSPKGLVGIESGYL